MPDVLNSLSKVRRVAFLGCALSALAACGDIRPAPLATVTAQPKTPAQRNLTPFYPALQCMDTLFLQARRPTVLLSSNQIPDRTRRISVDARSMIITALNHMTRRSGAFQFVEQGIYKRTAGDTLELERDATKGHTPPRPILYFSGSISQVDNATRRSSLEVVGDVTEDGNPGLASAEIPNALENSIVTLDLHLVRFPSRIVVPGSAISNSMVVSSRRRSAGFVGIISQRTLGFELELESVESQGQAVRSLVELGLIEMLGTYAGVPFWECLSRPDLAAFETAQKERRHTVLGVGPGRLREFQRTLAVLGHGPVPATGRMDDATRKALSRFQASEGLLANGSLDFDTLRALEEAQAALPKPAPPKPQTVPKSAAAPKRKTSTAKPPSKENDGFRSLGSFLDDTS